MKNILALMLFIFSQFTSAQVVANELDADVTSTNTSEFNELKSTTANFPFYGHLLVFFK